MAARERFRAGFNALFPIRAVRKLPLDPELDTLYVKTSVFDLRRRNKVQNPDDLLAAYREASLPTTVNEELSGRYLAPLREIQIAVRARNLSRSEQRRIMGEALQVTVDKQKSLKSQFDAERQPRIDAAKAIIADNRNYAMVQGQAYPLNEVGRARKALGQLTFEAGIVPLRAGYLRDELQRTKNPGKFAQFLDRHF